MVATASRIGFVTQQYRTVVSSDAAVTTRYGELARDTGDEPIESFFDSPADAQVVNDARLVLLKGSRRRFRMDARGVQTFTGSMDLSQVTPTVTVIDDERSANLPAACVEVSVDPGGEKTTFANWG